MQKMNIEQIMLSGKTTLIDVRSVEEFEEQSLPGAINIPLHTIPLRVEEFKVLPNPIVVFCRSGARSYQAATWLKRNGVEANDGGSITAMLELLK
jgi:phage shock protein E